MAIVHRPVHRAHSPEERARSFSRTEPVVPARHLLLVRHAAVSTAMQGRFLGRTDVPLAPEGLHHVRALTSRLHALHPRRCLASPLIRARETAELLAEPLGLTVEMEPDLREADFGDWEGRTFDEIHAADPAAAGRWAACAADFVFPGGESVAAFLTRVCRAALRLAAAPEDAVLVVTHGGVIRALLCHFLGLDFRHAFGFEIPYASLATLKVFGERGVLTGLDLGANPHVTGEPTPVATERG